MRQPRLLPERRKGQGDPLPLRSLLYTQCRQNPVCNPPTCKHRLATIKMLVLWANLHHLHCRCDSWACPLLKRRHSALRCLVAVQMRPLDAALLPPYVHGQQPTAAKVCPAGHDLYAYHCGACVWVCSAGPVSRPCSSGPGILELQACLPAGSSTNASMMVLAALSSCT